MTVSGILSRLTKRRQEERDFVSSYEAKTGEVSLYDLGWFAAYRSITFILRSVGYENVPFPSSCASPRITHKKPIKWTIA